uniref:Pentacotripeptide-repeat region of PRORP domain-containing protein n=3 Tax=Nymphaea colorata TaxID=210225 RepID=A0A5K1AQ54_9MAGN
MTEAQNLLKRLMQKGVALTIVLYNTIVDGYCRAESMEAALLVVEEMEANGMKASRIAYNSVLNGYCKMQKVVSAEKVFAEMMQKGLMPDVVTYILLDGHGKVGQFERF